MSLFGLPDGTVVKSLPNNAGEIRDMDSTPKSERAPGVGNGNHSSILAWKIPWTEKPGKLLYGVRGVTKSQHDGVTEHACTFG